MKTNTEIICTVVPHGVDDKKKFYFSVFLTPRLYQSGTLRLYDEVKQWHQYREFFSNNKRLKVRFGSLEKEGEQMEITPQNLWENVSYRESEYKKVVNDLIDSSKEIVIWKQLFDGTTPVKGWAEHHEVTNENLSPLYSTGVNGPTSRNLFAKSAAENLHSLAKSLAYSKSFEDIRKKSLTSDEIVSNKENQEFHSKMSILSDYPHLLRLLGWIYDFSFQLTDEEEIKTLFYKCNLIKFMIDGFEPAQGNGNSGRNLWESFSKYVTFITPWTYFDPNTFFIKYRDTLSEGNPYYEIQNGFLKSSSKGYEIKATQIDLKRMIQKYLETESKNETSGFSISNGLSSTGIALVIQNPISQKLPIESAVNATPALATLNETTPPEEVLVENKNPTNNYVLFGHHLDTGYRIDVIPIEKATEVEESPGTEEPNKAYDYTYQMKGGEMNFYSLCRRLSDYLIDKGYQKEVLLQSFEDEPWVAESAQIGASGKLYYDIELCRWNNWSLTCPPLGDYPQDEEGEVIDKFYNDIELRDIKPVLGSLVPLRFGKRYAFRIRVVDICGHSKTLKDSSPLKADGIPDPDYLIHSDLPYKRFEPVDAPGIYFQNKEDNYGESLETLIIKTTIEADTLICSQDSIRIVAPPKSNFQFVESHGVLDELLKQKDGRKAVYEKAANFPIYPELYEVEKEIPFLTDPGCKGFSVTVKNFSTDNMTQEIVEWETFGKKLLNRCFFGLKISGDEVTEEEIDRNEGFITIRIKPGSIYDVLLKSVTHENPNNYEPTDYDPHNTPLPINILYPLSNDDSNKLTSPRKIKILHVVQKPVVQRKGEQEVFFSPSYGLQLKVKDRTPSNPILIKFSELKFDLKPGINAPCFPISTSAEFILTASTYDIIMDNADKKGYRKVDRKIQKSFSNLGEEEKLKYEDNFNSENFLKEFDGFEHSFSDTKFRQVKYALTAVSRFREYFPEKKPEDLQVEGNVQEETIIRNSDLPEAPVIHSIVPIFTWSSKRNNITREQNTIRVYFEGDWYSSGPGEKVAILFLQDQNSINEHYQGLVSEYGKDPSTPGAATTGLKKGFFQTENIVGKGETDKIDYKILGKQASNEVTEVMALTEEILYGAVYEVGFDLEVKRFYSDIVLILEKETKLYSPFLKMAVCRYQEHSIREKNHYDYRFSPVVMAPAVQLLPPRKISWKSTFHPSTLTIEQFPNKPGNKVFIFLENELSSGELDNETPNGAPKIIEWDEKEDISSEGFNLLTIEEYEEYEVGPPEFKVANDDGVAYNPRNDIRKRLVFSYQHRLETS